MSLIFSRGPQLAVSIAGFRSLGEPPTIPTSGAVAAAVYNAIGVPIRHLPLTPDKVLGALAEGRA